MPCQDLTSDGYASTSGTSVKSPEVSSNLDHLRWIGEYDRKYRPAAKLTFHLDGRPVLVQNPPNEGQTQPRPPGLGSEEGFKDPIQVLWSDPHPRIFDTHLGPSRA